MSAEFCTEEEIAALVHAFYAQVRRDPMLGPFFDSFVDDWDAHLARLVDFWSSVLRGTGRFSGMPMPLHAALPGLTAGLFQRWLAIFRETTATLPNREMARVADEKAQRIARSLWHGYQIARNPMATPGELPGG